MNRRGCALESTTYIIHLIFSVRDGTLYMITFEGGRRRGRTSDERVVRCDFRLTESEISNEASDEVSVNQS